MKRYKDCIRTDGMCGACSLSSRGFDCHNNRINSILYNRSVIGMTQKELAEKLDMTKQHVSDMERDKRAISRKTAKLLGGIFRISPARFI